MTRRLRPEERARAVPPLSKVAREFIDVHLATGATPSTIRRVYNEVARMNPEEADRLLPRPRGFLRNQPGRTWYRILGERPLTAREVRREYDRLRKFRHGEGTLNKARQRELYDMSADDIRNSFLRAAIPGNTHEVRRGERRALHDIALARRYGATRGELHEMADRLDVDIPLYLDVI